MDPVKSFASFHALHSRRKVTSTLSLSAFPAWRKNSLLHVGCVRERQRQSGHAVGVRAWVDVCVMNLWWASYMCAALQVLRPRVWVASWKRPVFASMHLSWVEPFAVSGSGGCKAEPIPQGPRAEHQWLQPSRSTSLPSLRKHLVSMHLGATERKQCDMLLGLFTAAISRSWLSTSACSPLCSASHQQLCDGLIVQHGMQPAQRLEDPAWALSSGLPCTAGLNASTLAW